MTQTQVCPECGMPLPKGVAEGLCMHCLLKGGLSETVTTARFGAPSGAADSVPQTLPDFGPYHTIGVLGEGGMGIVYLAEQREPVRRRVALKVLKSGDLGSTVLARFESESQALALMDHPNIARIFDAGTTSGGRPYFAMEYVPGIPITDYCDRNLLGFQERLALFQQVCHAVQHAHQKGIVHRDIKPSNVLVMLQDGKPVPKVIDFGVAKALNQRLVEKTLFTEIGMLIGTPEYMSPEQADLTGLDIDSTTDIYSLGVLLYELLVGALPFDSKTLRKAGYAEIQRIIRETEPPRPSTRLSSMGGEVAQEIARQRHSDVHGLTRLLRGDLEWITMKALEKDRTRRYASASEFAADIARHVANEPVVAGPPGIGYRTQKFVRRNHGLVLAGAAVAVALLAGAVVSFSLYLKAVQQQERAEGESYSANLTVADVQLRDGETDIARSRLAMIPPALRGWEWSHLMSRTDDSVSTIYSHNLVALWSHGGSPEIVFNQDGTQIFAFGGTTLRSWDVATNRPEVDFGGLGRVLAVGSHGKTVLVGPQVDDYADLPAEGVVLRLYDVSTRQVLAEFRGMIGNPGESAISDDGRLVATAVDPKEFGPANAPITVWDAHTGQVKAHLEGHTTWVSKLRFSPDGEYLASCALEKTIQLWSMSTFKKGFTLKHESGVRGFVFSKDGRLLASGSTDGTVRIWNPATGVKLRSWKTGAQGFLFSGAFSSDASQLATVQGSIIRVWDVATGTLRKGFGGRSMGDAVAFHPSEPRLYVFSSPGELREWDLDRRTVIDDATWSGLTALSPDGKWISSITTDGKVWIYDSETGKLLRSWTGHAADTRGFVVPPFAIAFSADSNLVASSFSENAIKVWNRSDGRLIRTFSGHTALIHSIAFSPDGQRIVSGSADQTIRIWNLAPNVSSGVISTTSPIARVAVSSDGRTVLALRRKEKSIALWDIETKQSLGLLDSNTPESSEGLQRDMAVTSDGRTAIVPANSGETVAVWDLPNRRLKQILRVFPENGTELISLAISPDGSRLAVGGASQGNISVWDLNKRRLLVTLGGHSVRVFSIAWTPDGTRLISGSSDGTIQIWDSRSHYNHAAELLMDRISPHCLLPKDCIDELNADRTIPDDVRQAAIRLATAQGNPAFEELFDAARRVGEDSKRSAGEYEKALRQAAAAVQAAPWSGYGHVTLAFLQYRTGEFAKALSSGQRAVELQKSLAPDAHAIRAVAFYRLKDLAQAQSELELARKAAGESKVKEDHKILEEAERVLSDLTKRELR